MSRIGKIKAGTHRKDGRWHCFGCGNGFDVAFSVTNLCTGCLVSMIAEMQGMAVAEVRRVGQRLNMDRERSEYDPLCPECGRDMVQVRLKDGVRGFRCGECKVTYAVQPWDLETVNG